MANLQDLLDDPEKREGFVRAVVEGSRHREEVILNAGISTREQLRDLICQEPVGFAEHRLSLGEVAAESGSDGIDPRQLDELLRQEPVAFGTYNYPPVH